MEAGDLVHHRRRGGLQAELPGRRLAKSRESRADVQNDAQGRKREHPPKPFPHRLHPLRRTLVASTGVARRVAKHQISSRAKARKPLPVHSEKARAGGQKGWPFKASQTTIRSDPQCSMCAAGMPSRMRDSAFVCVARVARAIRSDPFGVQPSRLRLTGAGGHVGESRDD